MNRFAYIILLVILFDACKKYEEGPAFTLRSRKERLSNSWGIKLYKVNGEDKTNDFLTTYKDYNFNLVRGGAYSLSYSFNNQEVSETGVWQFADNDKAFEILAGTQFSVPRKFYILKLKEKELWCYTETTPGIKEEFHFKPK